MKVRNPLGLIILTFLLSGLSMHAQTHLFILSGQSNMAGLKPDISFTPAVRAAFGEANVLVVKDAHGGQAIRRWHRAWKPNDGEAPEGTGDLYERLMTRVKTATDSATFDTVTFVWMQGERDAREKHGEVYADSLRGLLSQLRTDLGREDINFVIGRLSDFDMPNKRYPHWTMVREAQVAVAEASPRGRWVDTDDLNGDKNGLHYTSAGYKLLGQRFAEQAIELINNNRGDK